MAPYGNTKSRRCTGYKQVFSTGLEIMPVILQLHESRVFVGINCECTTHFIMPRWSRLPWSKPRQRLPMSLFPSMLPIFAVVTCSLVHSLLLNRTRIFTSLASGSVRKGQWLGPVVSRFISVHIYTLSRFKTHSNVTRMYRPPKSCLSLIFSNWKFQSIFPYMCAVFLVHVVRHDLITIVFADDWLLH